MGRGFEGMARQVLAVAGAALLALAACGGGNREPHLMNLRSSTDGPDEFAILPPKALQLPTDLAALPDPTPGGANLTDPHPLDDGILALGGKVPNPVAGIPSGDAGLVNYAARKGVTAGIRTSLDAEDLAFRKKHPGKLLERAFAVNTYYKAYRDQWLDAYAELLRWRQAGVATPSAPPEESLK